MSLELHPTDVSAAEALFKTWQTSTDVELEATFKALDMTSWLNVIQHLRSLGLREEAQTPKLNIMVPGGLRFTLVGEGLIEEYCNDNVLVGKPFHCVLKEKKRSGASAASVGDERKTEVDWAEYGVRVKLRRELPLAMDDVRVRDALSRWASLPKSYRYITRYSFTSLQHKGLVFDLSLVRQNRKGSRGEFIPATSFLSAEIGKQPVQYEAEVEVVEGASYKALIVGIATVLRGIQRSFALVRNTVRKNVLEFLAATTGAAFNVFPAPKPATIELANIMPTVTPNIPNIRFDDYNVTDKADGERCLLVVVKTGAIFLVDMNMNVYGTDLRLPKAMAEDWWGTVLDGEWVRQDAAKNPVCRYYAFDILNGRKGEDVSVLPFIVRGADSDVGRSRYGILSEATGILANAERYMTAPAHQAFSVHMKEFKTSVNPADTFGIFKEASAMLDRVDPPYHTDGLIFTPNASPLPKLGRSWPAQMKWKPSSENTIDFLVRIEHELDPSGSPLPTERISIKAQEDTNQIVRYKTLRLFVGYSTDPALANPRDAILNKKPLPATLEREGGDRGRRDMRPGEFVPDANDPMASVCFMAINAGATDPAAATAASSEFHSLDESVRCLNGDPIQSNSIVEMAYHPEKPAGWRWEPLRVRWDKTEKFQGGIVGGTMNAAWVADTIWNSIHTPITESMIRTGALEESQEEAGRVMTSEMAQAYYIRKAPSRDLFKIRGLRKFHNHIKEDLLLARVLKRGAALFDMTCGRAGDIHKWIAAQPGWVLGTDIAEKNLTDAKDSAYQRYLTQMIQLGGKVPPMLFVQADASQRLSDGGAGQSALDRAMLRTLWGSEEALTPPYAQLFRGKAADGFDVLSCMFSIHYFFKDRPTIDGWLRNISQSLRVGGYFVGCCFDGDAIIGFLQSLPFDGVRRGSEGGGDIWTIQKRYEENSLPPTDEGLGKAIDVSFISIGNTYTEYLVSWPYLQERLGAIGLELLNPEELAELGLQHSTNMFGESYEMSARNGRAFPMTPTIKQFSFLNRWFIFKRRSMGAEIPYTAPGMQAAFVESDAAVDAAAGPIGPTGRAPASEVFADDSTIAQVGPKLVVEEVAIEEEPVVGFTAAAAAAAAAKQAVEEVDVDDIEAAEEDDDEEEEEAEEEAEKPLVKANGPIYKFYQKGELKDDLGLKDKGWRRWLATYAPFPLKDWRDPTVLYPSMEAALAAAKYQIATNKPELGPTLFSMDGAIHQKYAGIRLEKGTLSEKDEYALQEDEGDEVRKAMKPAEIKKAGAKLDEKAWLTGLREVIDAYVRQRFAADARFAKILGAIKEKRAHLMFYTTPKGNEFSGFINDDGDIEGANLYGRALMKVVGLYYPE